jgi:hypothetical protein
MIRLHQKVNTVLELREKEMQNETEQPKNKNKKTDSTSNQTTKR